MSILSKQVKTQLQPKPPQVGSKVTVTALDSYEVTVSAVTPLQDGRIKIYLDWGTYGHSHVWLHDEGSTWSRNTQLN